jgi:FkbM family methyltransferase
VTRKLIVIGEHTVDVSFLTPYGWVLDAGCRDFAFARGIVERAGRVLAVDADPSVVPPDDLEHVLFLNIAVAHESGVRHLVMTADPQARHLEGLYTASPSVSRHEVRAHTVEQLMNRFGINQWDAVKLDIEGAEYGILNGWPGPIAKQISVEFHEHCAPRPQWVYDQIFARLGKWYEAVQHEKSARHCLPPNYWDTLFVLKEEFQ